VKPQPLYSSRRAHLELVDKTYAYLKAHPGARFDELWNELAPPPWPTIEFGMLLQSALNALKTDGKIRYVSRTSVPFDPIATSLGWWPTELVLLEILRAS
jgi:hypothetical protein